MAKKNKEYTFIDLFAGIGGFHIALHKLGAKCVFISENDKFARQIYRDNFYKISPHLFDDYFNEDIKEITSNNKNIENIPDHDILCAGFPCQPFSQAGLQNGFADPRGTFIEDITRIIAIKKPRAFILENVSNFHGHNNGRTFKTVKYFLKEKLKYSFDGKVLMASDFGLPQRRPRLFMIGFRNNKLPINFPKKKKLNKTMTDIFGAKCEKDIGFTLRCGGRGSGIHDRRNFDQYMVDGEVRRLSPIEGKKLMDFQASFKLNVSETQAMHKLGNAVAVPVVKAVAREVINTLAQE